MATKLTADFTLRLFTKGANLWKALGGDVGKLNKVAKATTPALDKLNKVTAKTEATMGKASKATSKYGHDLARLEKRAAAVGRVWGRSLARGIGNTFSPQNVAGATKGVLALAGGIFTLATAGAVWVGSQAKQAEATLKSAQAAGIGVQAYQKLRFAFTSTGLDGDKLSDVLKSINVNSTKAAGGGKEQARAWKLLGINVLEGHKRLKSADGLLGEVADKFSKMKDGGKKNFIANALFGESGDELIPLLNGGSAGLKKMGDEAQRLGLVLDLKAIQAAKRLNDSWDKLKNNTFGVSNSIWTGLTPALTSVLDSVNNILTANKQDILSGLNKGLDWINTHMPDILKGTGDFFTFLGGVVEIGGKVTNALGGIGGVFDVLAGLMVGKLALGLASTISSIWGVNAAFLGCPITWIVGGIAAVAYGGYLLIRHWDKVSAFFGGLWTKLKEGFLSLPEWAQPFISLPMYIITHWDKLKTSFTALGAWLKKWFIEKPREWWASMPEWARGMITGAASIFLPGGPVTASLAARALSAPVSTPTPSGPSLSNLSDQSYGTRKSETLTRVEVEVKGPAKVNKVETSKGVDVKTRSGLLLQTAG
ncbi:hypothetical protein [Asticcacaulis sp. YBE204]|uniref:hypothetical protein n=1 Tax=Asticcacaulis sp. YBE204 TaxID=1282363 RepID=UPI0003C40948|nr:hypothetical protein [Asticcacaulis sp. YBE204]ESQ78516.1 hypothetical protein AEYBE204_13270 [Asticcacaulis sp. YBE204]